jgi:hypothetical protein
MDSLTRTNEETARRLFEAVEHRSRGGRAEIYGENIGINEAPSLLYGGEYRELEGALRHDQGFPR